MKILKCASCGANVKSNSTVCEYCGCVFELEKNKVEQTTEQPKTKPEIFNETTVKEVSELTANIEKLSWGIILIIFIVCWPVGLAFTIIKLNKDKNKQ